MNSKLKQDKTT